MYIFIYAFFLKDREKYTHILENNKINIILVFIYNIVCYLSVLLPADPNILIKPSIFENSFVIIWFNILAIILYILGGYLLFITLKMRKVIGAQDTEGKLLTNSSYSFFRHPIYLGISLIALGMVLTSINLDAMIIFPFILLGNYLTGTIEEKYDIEERFKKQYQEYKKKVRRFGPFYFWLFLLLIVSLPLCISIWIL